MQVLWWVYVTNSCDISPADCEHTELKNHNVCRWRDCGYSQVTRRAQLSFDVGLCDFSNLSDFSTPENGNDGPLLIGLWGITKTGVERTTQSCAQPMEMNLGACLLYCPLWTSVSWSSSREGLELDPGPKTCAGLSLLPLLAAAPSYFGKSLS